VIGRDKEEMGKKVVVILIALVVVITSLLTVSVLSENVNRHNLIICAFDQKPAGSDGTEWVAIYKVIGSSLLPRGF